MELLVAGNVQQVLFGKVTKQTLFQISTDKMKYALGGAAEILDGSINLGEAIIYDQTGYIFTPAHSWIEKKELQSPFLMGISEKPKKNIQIPSTKSIDILYQTMLKSFPNGFAVVGEVHFSNLAVAYLKKSPIYNENINANKDQYWENESFANQSVKIFGVVLPKADARIFYQNPNEKHPSILNSHTHALLKNQARHLLTHSSILSATLWISEISEVIES